MNVKQLFVLVPSLLLLAVLAAPLLAPAQAAPEEAAVAWEFKHLLIPLERKLEEYERADATILEALRRSGEEGWELVSAYEPAGGLLVRGRASVEFWLKRSFVPARRR